MFSSSYGVYLLHGERGGNAVGFEYSEGMEEKWKEEWANTPGIYETQWFPAYA